MSRFYTLEEAASVLGLSPEELRVEAENHSVDAFLDGDVWHFRADLIHELSHRRGQDHGDFVLNGDEDGSHGAPEASGHAESAGSGLLSGFGSGLADSTSGREGPPAPPPLTEDSLLDLQASSSDPTSSSSSSSVVLGWGEEGGLPDDSRLHDPAWGDPGSSGNDNLKLVEGDSSVQDAFAGPPVARDPMLDSSAGSPSPSEEFELATSEFLEAPSQDLESDFELSSLDDVEHSDPAPAHRPYQSAAGEVRGPASDDSVELAPLSGDEIESFSGLPDPSEETGFRAAVVEEEDHTIQFESASDFEAEGPESVSEVFALGENDVDQNSATSVTAAPLDDEEEEGGESGLYGDEGDEDLPVNPMTAAQLLTHEEGRAHRQRLVPDTEPAAHRRVVATAAEAAWGPTSFGLTAASAMLLMLCTFFAIDLASNLGGDSERSVTYGLVKQFAKLVGL